MVALRRLAVITSLIAGLNGTIYASPVESFMDEIYPYYKIQHVAQANGVYFANGVVVEEKERWDAMNNKIETPCYIRSYNDSLWQWCKPKGIQRTTDNDSVVYDAFPHNVVSIRNNFVAIIEVGENPNRSQVIHYSKDGVLWYNTGIYATSLHVVHDKIIAEHMLSLAVSANGEQWNVYAYPNWDNSFPEYTNQVPTYHQTISVESQRDSRVTYYDTDRSFNSKEDYPYITYDWFALTSYYRDSTYVLTDGHTFMALSHDAVAWKYVETPLVNDSVYALTFAEGTIAFLEITQGNTYLNVSDSYGKRWKRDIITLDTNSYASYSVVDVAIKQGQIYLETEVYYILDNEAMNVSKSYITFLYTKDAPLYESTDFFFDDNSNSTSPKNVSRNLAELGYYFKSIHNGTLVGIDY